MVLDEWPAAAAGRRMRGFTSVASWRGPFAPIEYEGVTYGLRVHEFRRFAELPRRSAEEFEVALDIHEAETADLELLAANGWRLADPAVAAGDPWAYRDYVQGSKAELMVAKGMYVTEPQRLDQRSQHLLPRERPARGGAGDGLLGAVSGRRRACSPSTTSTAPWRPSSAWRATTSATAARRARLAEEHFDSDKVLRRLLNELGIP